MSFKVYIQSADNFPISDWAVSAYMGFKERGAKVILIEDIMEVPASKEHMVVGFVQDTNRYLTKLGGQPLKALNIPDELISFAGRNINVMTMGEFKQDRTLPIFVKPGGLSKEYSDIFTAGVITKESSRQNFFNGVPDAYPVLVSEVVDFVSEYRCYVIDGQLKGIKHYLGDIRVFPNVKVIDAAISEYKTQPAGYAIDFGITSDGRTLLVEVNDGFSLGNYGLSDMDYSTLLVKRWYQIMRSI